jgi:hypothetical protein
MCTFLTTENLQKYILKMLVIWTMDVTNKKGWPYYAQTNDFDRQILKNHLRPIYLFIVFLFCLYWPYWLIITRFLEKSTISLIRVCLMVAVRAIVNFPRQLFYFYSVLTRLFSFELPLSDFLVQSVSTI